MFLVNAPRLRGPMSGLVTLSCVERPVLRTTGEIWALTCVENVLVRTAWKMIWRDNDDFSHKKAGRALRPTCFHQVTVGKLAVQPFAAIGINFILQDTEVQDLFVSDLAFVLPFPLSQERIESPRNVCSKYRPGLENE